MTNSERSSPQKPPRDILEPAQENHFHTCQQKERPVLPLPSSHVNMALPDLACFGLHYWCALAQSCQEETECARIFSSMYVCWRVPSWPNPSSFGPTAPSCIPLQTSASFYHKKTLKEASNRGIVLKQTARILQLSIR